MARRAWFGLFCWGEGGLVLVAALLGWALGLNPWATVRLDVGAVAYGVAGVLPPVGMLGWVLRSDWGPVVELRAWLEAVMREVFNHWRGWQLAMVSLLAGVGEESLFRGVIQAGLEGSLGRVGALLVAAAAFGCAHPISWLYAGLAGIMGLWFGLLWWWSGSLVAPVLAHALYDFIALTWAQRRMRQDGSSGESARNGMTD